jgi:hypothetical protein
MVNCTLCGKPIKSPQGLSGHMAFKHGVRKDTPISEQQEPATDTQLGKTRTEQAGVAAEKRLQYIERVLGITEDAWKPSSANRLFRRAEPLLESTVLSNLRDQQAELNEQVKKLGEQIGQQGASTERQQAELTAAGELAEKLRVSYNDLKQYVSKILPWAENNFSVVTSDLDLLFQSDSCHGHSGKGACELITSPAAVKAFNERLDLANGRCGKLPVVVARFNDQLFYKDKPDDGKQYDLYKGLGWALAKQQGG